MKISVLVPWRPDNGARSRLWDWCQRRWASIDIEVVEGYEDGTGPFWTTKAQNDAAARATGDVFLIYGADMVPNEGLVGALRKVFADPNVGWVAPFDRTVYTTKERTVGLLDSQEWLSAAYHRLVAHLAPYEIDTGCAFGVTAFRAEAWEALGRFDERFRGWGPEDQAWRVALTRKYGQSPVPNCEIGPVVHLWHPTRQGSTDPADVAAKAANYALFEREYR